MVKSGQFIASFTSKMSGDKVAMKALLKGHEPSIYDSKVLSKVSSEYQKSTNIALELTSYASRMIRNPPNSPKMTNSDVFGNYNSRVLAGISVEIFIMKAMTKMTNVTNTVAQRQTQLEQGMQGIQTKMNNYLSQQLQAENPFLSHLAALGKKKLRQVKCPLAFLQHLETCGMGLILAVL